MGVYLCRLYMTYITGLRSKKIHVPVLRLFIFYYRCLLTKHEGHGRKLGRPLRLEGRGFKDGARDSIQDDEEPCYVI